MWKGIFASEVCSSPISRLASAVALTNSSEAVRVEPL
jgi:hypothetical protein